METRSDPSAHAVQAASSDPRRDDLAADRLTYLWVTFFMMAALAVDILSHATEIGRSDSGETIWLYVIYETTGYLVILALFPIVAFAASRATPGQHEWRVVVPVHFASSIVVSLLHVGVMVSL